MDGNYFYDAYIEDMKGKLKQIRYDNKEAEKEAKQMNLRLNTLKNENENNWTEIKKKKIETTQRVKRLDNFIKRKEQTQKLKEEKMLNIEKQREQNRLLRDSIKYSSKKDEYLNSKLEKALLAKLQREYNRELAIYLKNVEKMNNKKKVDLVKSHSSAYQANKNQKLMQVKEGMVRDLENQLLNEYQKREFIEKEKMRIENEGNDVLRQIEESNKIKEDYDKRLNLLTLDNLYYNSTPIHNRSISQSIMPSSSLI